MKRIDIIKKVNEFLTEEFEAELEGIPFDENFHEALELDSLDYVDLVVLVEHSFGFKMKGEDFKSIMTFNDLYDFINSSIQVHQQV